MFILLLTLPIFPFLFRSLLLFYRWAHDILAGFYFKASDQPIHALRVLQVTPDNTMLVSGSSDNSLKIWDLKTLTPHFNLPTNGKVTDIEVKDNLIVLAVDEAISKEKADITTGTVYVCNVQDMKPIPVHRSEELPYTHPFGEIRSISLFFQGDTKIIITGGGEGLVRIWKFEPTSNKFEQISVLEGHVRAVTCVLLQDQYLWTGSMDHTIRVWEVASGRCLGVLSSVNGGKGHSAPVSCLASVMVGPQKEVHIVSGGGDNEIKIWKTNGDFVHSFTQSAWITSLTAFQDEVGGIPVLLIGLADGSIACRSCNTMNLLFVIHSDVLSTSTVWSIVNLGKSFFASAGEDGQIIAWQIQKPLQEPKTS